MRSTLVICLGLFLLFTRFAAGDDATDLVQTLRTEGPIGWTVWRDRAAEFRMTVRTTESRIRKATNEHSNGPAFHTEFVKAGDNVRLVVQRNGVNHRTIGRNDQYQFLLKASESNDWLIADISATADVRDSIAFTNIDEDGVELAEGVGTSFLARAPYSFGYFPLEHLIAEERFIVDSVRQGATANLVDVTFTFDNDDNDDNDDNGQHVFPGFPLSTHGVISFDRTDNWAIQRIDYENESGWIYAHIVEYGDYDGTRFPSSITSTRDSPNWLINCTAEIEELSFEEIPPERFRVSQFGFPEPELADENP